MKKYSILLQLLLSSVGNHNCIKQPSPRTVLPFVWFEVFSLKTRSTDFQAFDNKKCIRIHTYSKDVVANDKVEVLLTKCRSVVQIAQACRVRHLWCILLSCHTEVNCSTSLKMYKPSIRIWSLFFFGFHLCPRNSLKLSELLFRILRLRFLKKIHEDGVLITALSSYSVYKREGVIIYGLAYFEATSTLVAQRTPRNILPTSYHTLIFFILSR